ncbi:uncharacterized protein LOC128996266 [Macrosteles quadrilineatus]|uniref:uncharacterized protein LOC128996266 n=1 Tax=Macrosteles quadrilineatus TaxID=74068 RepID=UPI0023E2E9DE|nr:uncharacterized protein LOC128996266 [Macrosteles quadrilineatus]
MKGKIVSARKRLSHIIRRAKLLGIDLQDSHSTTLLRQSCCSTETSASTCLLVLSISFLTLVFTWALGHYICPPVQCTSPKFQDLHIKTLNWRLPRDEGVEHLDIMDLNLRTSNLSELSTIHKPPESHHVEHNCVELDFIGYNSENEDL